MDRENAEEVLASLSSKEFLDENLFPRKVDVVS